MVTPDGYYHASKGALGKVIYFKEGKIYRFDNYDLKYNRPDIIMERLGFADIGTIELYKKAYLKRLKRVNIKEQELTDTDTELPEVTLPGLK